MTLREYLEICWGTMAVCVMYADGHIETRHRCKAEDLFDVPITYGDMNGPQVTIVYTDRSFWNDEF